MTVIHAEIATDHRDLVLVAGGDHLQDIALAAKMLKALTPAFAKSDPAGALVVPLTWTVVVQLSVTFGDYWRPGPKLCDWITEQTALRTEPVGDTLSYTPPAGLVPREYQIAGALEIARTGRALIFDEPRTGKTITTILGVIEHAVRHNVIDLGQAGAVAVEGHGPIIVVCPASVIDPWVQAWQEWAPRFRTVAWRGDPKKRHALAGTADVYVTSYDTARMDAPTLSKKGPLRDLGADYLVVDECHLVKNHQAERTKAVGRLATDVIGFVALSGTPITHHPADLWPTLKNLAPGAQPSRERWVNRYCNVLSGDYKEEILGLNPFREPEFRLSILGQHRRVARADVMSQLPPKVYSVRTVDLPADWRKSYDAMEAQMLAELPDGSEMSVMGVLAQLTRLSQLASAAAEVQEVPDPNGALDGMGQLKVHTKVLLKAPSWKVDAMLGVLEERPGEQVVVFSPSRQLIVLAGAAAQAAGHKVGYVIGGQNPSERTEAIRAFQAGEINVICATTGAGGTGITLSAAGTLIFLQRPWSLVEALQAEDRAEGDLESVRGTEVIDIVARNTIDTRVRAVLRERAGQLADLVQDRRIVSELLGGTAVERTNSPERKAS